MVSSISRLPLGREDIGLHALQILRDYGEASIDRHRLTALANEIGEKLSSNRTEHDSGTGEQLDPRLPINDRNMIQYTIVRRSQGFVIWRRLNGEEGKTEAWDCMVNGKIFTGERAINACLLRALNAGLPLLDAQYLAEISSAEVQNIYRDERDGAVTLPLIEWRRSKLNEIGQTLLDLYNGQSAQIFEDADRQLFRADGRGIVQRLVIDFPFSFGDFPFAKLAGVICNSLYSLRLETSRTDREFAELTNFSDPHNLFAETDYYIPMFLIRWGVIVPGEDLFESVVNHRLIEPSSPVELSFRAATFLALDRLVEETGIPMSRLAKEAWLTGAWRCRLCKIPSSSQEDAKLVSCPYRSDCMAFQRRPEFMAADWPLVHTPNY